MSRGFDGLEKKKQKDPGKKISWPSQPLIFLPRIFLPLSFRHLLLRHLLLRHNRPKSSSPSAFQFLFRVFRVFSWMLDEIQAAAHGSPRFSRAGASALGERVVLRDVSSGHRRLSGQASEIARA
jgi:hypothetical protein